MPKAPQAVFETIFAFAPNRETLGGTAYLILEQDPSGESANILIDCPAFSDDHQRFIAAKGGVKTLFITHRGGMAQVPAFQRIFEAQVLIQEQEAYLLPTVTTERFHRERQLSPISRVFWNAGHSPGSACLYHSLYGGVLFTGRHLLPNREGAPAPLRLSKTFHWPRQLRYSQQLLADFSPETLSSICPGASTGFLRGEKKISHAYEKLQSLDWQALAAAQPAL
ncbi:MAG: MBL fold metallo-hydrolase [Phormidesmis priestleyi]|uniref:MBL fold metallo-hydrolase n=1 Tax=Phormidesmis priestleyi TaxID=268141 RepID=A0A2W4XRX8_9CYAN|nr:MAG: MBL fold metallo-hydrolase [Phormidesmis priestleyi]